MAYASSDYIVAIDIDTISSINMKDGMCHMKVDWFTIYTI